MAEWGRDQRSSTGRYVVADSFMTHGERPSKIRTRRPAAPEDRQVQPVEAHEVAYADILGCL
ncbi:hypothetical protein [Streptomyces adelaidensis]|uniref:hypothetical protein n=1 Tax=Streptomyces adelaidensis TaxID=2796465 RepID=UPI001908E82C|nr:hypothetical protein [Streptomyces adelaidensis]